MSDVIKSQLKYEYKYILYNNELLQFWKWIWILGIGARIGGLKLPSELRQFWENTISRKHNFWENIISEKTCHSRARCSLVLRVWQRNWKKWIWNGEYIYSGLKIPKSLFNYFVKTVRTWNFKFWVCNFLFFLIFFCFPISLLGLWHQIAFCFWHLHPASLDEMDGSDGHGVLDIMDTINDSILYAYRIAGTISLIVSFRSQLYDTRRGYYQW